jgi:hypothetical protein
MKKATTLCCGLFEYSFQDAVFDLSQNYFQFDFTINNAIICSYVSDR